LLLRLAIKVISVLGLCASLEHYLYPCDH